MKNLLLRSILSAFILIAATGTGKTQSQAEKLTPEQLYITITRFDSTVFEAYNTCDLQKFKTCFTDDVEFYHDKEGLTVSLQRLMESIEKGLCNTSSQWRTRREIIPGSLKVYPLNKYGAILSGEHRFYEREIGGKEYIRSVARFTHVIQEKDGVWKISRVLSYDHQPVQ